MRGTLVLVVVFIVVATACYNVRQAEVRLAGNPVGAECFAACQRFGNDDQIVDCVATCPGATRSCDGLACAERRRLSVGKSALLVIGGVVLLALLVSSTSSTSEEGP